MISRQRPLPEESGYGNLKQGLLFTAPWLLGMLLFTLLPALLSFYYSFHDYSVLTEPIFVGTGNYQDLAKDETFRTSLTNTLLFGVMALPGATLLALVLAFLIESTRYLKGLFQVLFFIPSLVPLVVVALLWQFIFRADVGIANAILEKLFRVFGLEQVGLTEGPNWLGSTLWSKPALVVTFLWAAGQPMVIYLAGLQDIPQNLYDTAEMDGANWFQKTRHVTLPLLSPLIYFNLIVGTIGILQVFTVPYVMMGPQGDPLRSSLFYLMYLFDQAFRKLNMGYACAMAWLLFVVIALLTYGAHKVAERRVFHREE
ncbi:MAG: sugar ABC transporter permease [Candidatus Sumerlaeia bacterium]|nr:sugar ABC transporter permease [Candidatus Sumerlaeia bacterium]